jgi:hypothetical protein
MFRQDARRDGHDEKGRSIAAPNIKNGRKRFPPYHEQPGSTPSKNSGGQAPSKCSGGQADPVEGSTGLVPVTGFIDHENASR